VQTGGVEVSKFCLFSVALPAKCVSSVSPRFHFRRHAFFFLLLAVIFESPISHFIFIKFQNVHPSIPQIVQCVNAHKVFKYCCFYVATFLESNMKS
jgi:hypothetical protein